VASLQQKLASRLAGVLVEGEEVEAVVRGMYGTLPGGGYRRVAWNAGSTLDPYLVALTSSRLLGVRDGVGRSARQVAFEAERRAAHVEVRRRLVVFDWIGFVFHDQEFRLLVPRQLRSEVQRMADSLASGS
jgi:hypothetical protein